MVVSSLLYKSWEYITDHVNTLPIFIYQSQFPPSKFGPFPLMSNNGGITSSSLYFHLHTIATQWLYLISCTSAENSRRFCNFFLEYNQDHVASEFNNIDASVFSSMFTSFPSMYTFSSVACSLVPRCLINCSWSCLFCSCIWVNILTVLLVVVDFSSPEGSLSLGTALTHTLDVASLTTSHAHDVSIYPTIRNMTAISTMVTVCGSNFEYLCWFSCRGF